MVRLPRDPFEVSDILRQPDRRGNEAEAFPGLVCVDRAGVPSPAVNAGNLTCVGVYV